METPSTPSLDEPSPSSSPVVSEERASRKPWERMPKEPANWFAAFQTYLNLGRDRTIVKAENFGRKEPLKIGKQASGSWQKASATWHWPDRAAEWDADQAVKATQTVEACNARQKDASAKIFALVAEKVLKLWESDEILDQRTVKELRKVVTLIDRVNTVGAVTAMHRASFGDRSKVEVTTKEKEIDWDVPYSPRTK